MTDKEFYLDFWGYKVGTPEADAAWEAKQNMKDAVVDAPLVSIFNEGPYEHVGPTPMRFKSKKELRTYCRSKGLTSDYAE